MKNISILYVLLIFTCSCNSQSISGYWTGTMEMNDKTIDMEIDLNSKEKTFSSYDLMILERPVSNLTIKNETIRFSLVFSDAEVFFDGRLLDNEISGTASIDGVPPTMQIKFSLAKQAEKQVKPYSIESYTIKSSSVTLSADIYKPRTEGLHPAIVLLHGSASNVKTDYIFYADNFAKLGFEVLIFDKRGSGKSTGDYYLSSYDDLIADAIVCLETMHNRESVDENKIGLWGLSQGAMLLPKIASNTNIPKFLIAISPDVNSVAEAAAFQDSLSVVNSGNSELNGQIVAKSHRTVGKMIAEGKSYNEVEAFIRQNAQKYSFMNQTGLPGYINIDKDAFNGFYWKDRAINFISFWESINIPTLVVYGGRDRLVNAERNILILKSLNNENLELKLFPRANHVLKKSFNPSIDTEFDFPRIIEGYTEYVEKWIEEELNK